MIEVKGLSVTYPDGTRALESASFSVQEGERVALIGANGAGKSTLLMALVGVCEKAAGSVNIAGIELTKKNLPALRAHAGVVLQNPDDQLFCATVYDDVAFGPRNMGMDEAAVERRVATVLSDLGIEKLRDRMPHRLSGGEKRVAAIASVLSMRPSVMLFDEPTSFLDPRARRHMAGLLSRLPHTMLIATHDLDMALEVCQRVIVLKGGRLLSDGPARKLLTDGDLMDAAGLELPLSFGGYG
ncbi:MAG: energy-coupling factor ABC transporter ATP-binding protein [Christensenellales bacterium]|jgi:cobalt/nickel transport system ATP-binding protein